MKDRHSKGTSSKSEQAMLDLDDNDLDDESISELDDASSNDLNDD